MVAEVKHNRGLPCFAPAAEALAGLVLRALRTVAATGKVGHAQVAAWSLDHATQRILLDPYLRAPSLSAPNVLAVLLRDSLDDLDG